MLSDAMNKLLLSLLRPKKAHRFFCPASMASMMSDILACWPDRGFTVQEAEARGRQRLLHCLFGVAAYG